MHLVHTTRFRRGKLPHWEIEDGRYFVTVRLGDSLPREVVLRLEEIHRALAAIEARSAQFAALQRQYFLTMEKYLDAGTGACVLKDEPYASCVVDELEALNDWSVAIPHFTIMPNHWHALIVPERDCQHSLGEIMKRVKGRTGKRLRQKLGGTGAIWQREWFDRWIRNEPEWQKTIAYIQQNPVKAGLVKRTEDHASTR
jgi:REP element-mobilizing transposase RayT